MPPRVLPLLTTLRRELLLLMLPIHRQLLRPLRPLRTLGVLRTLWVLAGLVLRLLRRLVLGHDRYFVRRT